MDKKLMERIRQAKKSDADREVEKQQRQNALEEKLTADIKALTPRIKELIETANALIDAGYYEEFLESYGSNGSRGFCSEGWAHHIGFMYNSTTGHIDSMGRCNGGWNGNYDFHTTGDSIYMTAWHCSQPVDHPIKWGDAADFVAEFDKLETKFRQALEAFLQTKNA